MIIDLIRNAARNSNPAQRNWDHSAEIPKVHKDLLIDVIKHAPTKQNETHYKVYVFDDPKKIYNIYRMTKHFSVPPLTDATQFTDNEGRTKKEYNVRNSQINANLLFAFCDDWIQDNARSLIHAIVDDREEVSPNAYIEKEKQRYYSLGIAAGELILAANMLGYRTGLCSAFWPHEMKQFVEDSELRLLVGVGVPTEDDRREHEEVYNKDILAEDRRTGPLDEKWKFPTFKKEINIKKM